MRLLLAAALWAAASLAGGEESARATAAWVVERLAEGDLEAVAQASNAPERRRQVLQDYRASVGEDDFRRVFAQYRQSPIVEEVALGPHRLVIWRLEAAGGHLAGQFYVEKEGRFVLDDVPSEARARLRTMLQERRRAARATP